MSHKIKIIFCIRFYLLVFQQDGVILSRWFYFVVKQFAKIALEGYKYSSGQKYGYHENHLRKWVGPFICMPPPWRCLSQPRDPVSNTGLSNQLIQPVAFTQRNLDIHSLDIATRVLFYSVSFINPQYLQGSGTKVHIFAKYLCYPTMTIASNIM